jgi:hypothetical protein
MAHQRVTTLMMSPQKTRLWSLAKMPMTLMMSPQKMRLSQVISEDANDDLDGNDKITKATGIVTDTTGVDGTIPGVDAEIP